MVLPSCLLAASLHLQRVNFQDLSILALHDRGNIMKQHKEALQVAVACCSNDDRREIQRNVAFAAETCLSCSRVGAQQRLED
jgi:hypothetical protein